jgi:hypothetical protein
MARGNWSFIHEYSIYEYMNIRFDQNDLKIRNVVNQGRIVHNPKWERVTSMEPIVDTAFPDIKSISLGTVSRNRPAEIKFISSKFHYHKTHPNEYSTFKKANGCIVVMRHDHLPKGLTDPIDVWELSIDDFSSFCRENFSRLLNRQIQSSYGQRVWIMYQGPNFNNKGVAPSARDSGIWCPTEAMTGFDLSPGDRVIFVKTSGAATQYVQPPYLAYERGQTKSVNWTTGVTQWMIDEIFIAEVVSPIFSRAEYCAKEKIPLSTQLWNNDTKKNGQWRWDRVFEFKKVSSAQPQKSASLIHNKSTSKFFDCLAEAYCYRKSRELSSDEYLQFAEVLHELV